MSMWRSAMTGEIPETPAMERGNDDELGEESKETHPLFGDIEDDPHGETGDQGDRNIGAQADTTKKGAGDVDPNSDGILCSILATVF